MNKKEREKQFEEINGRKRSESKLTPNKKIKIYIGIALAVLVTLILVSIFSYFLIGKKESNQVSSSVSTKETTSQASTSQASTSQGKTDETDKDKQEEIQKLKNQLTDLDTKITEAEALVSKLKKETAVPKLDIEAIKNNDLSSLEGTWRSQSGNEYIINDSGEVRATWFTNDQKYESVVGLKVSKGQDSRNPETASISAWVKDSVAGGFVVVAVPSGVVMQPGDDGKITDKSNHAEERLLSGQDYGSMLMKPEDVYYRVKPDTSKLEEEEKNLAQLQADRETIKSSLESKEKKN
ncbi:MAG: DUF6287 domain-containing protein [Streptococcus sp.]|uniref:DUF6287 domain-containing protein n=1 Tax=Streptococcus sp. oral taxon 064 TaxID=712624 RepID=UPI00080749B6|nr:DUF6287 domain-containing protein [Streptococcus sp. oral taxon 064]ANR75490.1 hypothetical protein AXF18_06010 [Streptococcus sp. oral taxon 064]MDU7194365.1 DUF6287 domain-containing protein [Streptococcus sp.]